MPFRTIRFKLTLWYVILLGITVTAFSVFLYITLAKGLQESLDNKLRTTAEIIAASLRHPLGPGPSLADAERIMREHFGLKPMGRFVQVLDEAGRRSTNLRNVDIPVSIHTLERAAKGEAVFETVRLRDGSRLRLVTVPILEGGRMLGIVQVGSPLEGIEEALDQLLLILLVAVPLVLVVASLGGSFLANKALRPVDEITRTAQRIGSGDLSQRISLEGRLDDEIGRLVSTFNEMIGRLESSFLQIKRFTADASHELKTPLTVLKGEIEVGLKRQRRPEEYRRVLASCLEEVDRMSRIVDDLLTLARADMGALQLQKERVDLGEVAEDVWRSLGRMAEEKGLHFTFQRDGEVAVWGDKDRLRQLLVNLVDNALKYTPPGGEVRLRVERDDTLALLTIQDTGEGIPPEDQERVFERFYRVDKARSRQRGGTGLGLSICKWIAEAHGGKISLESEVGKGSTFVVQLPLLAP
mgnify:FL=1